MLPPRRRIGTEAKSRLGKALAGPSFLIRISQASLITILLIVFVSFIDLSAYGSPALVPESIHLSAAIRHSGVHIYNDTTAPFFDESTSAFRQRFLEWSARHPADDSIFVSIASFRDNLCRETVAALFANANRPERVFVGICDQLVVSDPDDRPCLDMVDERFRPQIRVVQVPADRGAGPTHARYIASKLWAGETWFMQIDSHTKFLKGWDDHLVAMIKRLPDPERSIVTHYPVGSDTVLGDAPRPWICRSTHDNAPPGLIIQLPETCNDDNMSPGIALDDRGQKTTCFTPFLGAGFFAGRSTLLHDAPFDPYLKFLFHGEELLIAARLWTSGWELYTPSANLVSHAYGGRPKNVFVQVPTWFVHAHASEARARALLRNPLEMDKEGDYAKYSRAEMDELGMGTVRRLEDYLEYAGVDLIDGKLTSRCNMWFDPVSGKWNSVGVNAAQSPS
ncbi:Glycosyltransferase 2-like domain-containing protein [Plasmodiophora brassicae]